jgi:hypothetical protein
MPLSLYDLLHVHIGTFFRLSVGRGFCDPSRQLRRRIYLANCLNPLSKMYVKNYLLKEFRK